MSLTKFRLPTGQMALIDETGRVVKLQPLEEVRNFRDAGYMPPAVRRDRLYALRQGSKDDPEGSIEEQDSRIYYERSIAVSAGLAANSPGVQLLNPVQSAVNVGLARIEIIMTQALDTSLGLQYVDKTNSGTFGTANENKGLDTLTAVGAVSTPSSQAICGNTWTTSPALNTNWIRRQRMSSLGETTVWTWDPEGSNGPPLMIPPGASIVIAESNGAVTGSFIVNLRWQEERFGQKSVR